MCRSNPRIEIGLVVLLAAALAGCSVEVKHGERGAKRGIQFGAKEKQPPPPADAIELPWGSTRIGERITATERVALASVRADPAPYLATTLLVEADAANVCQNVGCWMTLSDGEGEPIFVTWSSGCGGKYAFPKDAGGKRVLVQGTLTEKEISPADAAHIAGESDGLSAEDIGGRTFEIVATSFVLLGDQSPVGGT